MRATRLWAASTMIPSPAWEIRLLRISTRLLPPTANIPASGLSVIRLPAMRTSALLSVYRPMSPLRAKVLRAMRTSCDCSMLIPAWSVSRPSRLAVLARTAPPATWKKTIPLKALRFACTRRTATSRASSAPTPRANPVRRPRATVTPACPAIATPKSQIPLGQCCCSLESPLIVCPLRSISTRSAPTTNPLSAQWTRSAFSLTSAFTVSPHFRARAWA